MELANFIWAWLAVWLAGIWVAMWQWFLSKRSVEIIWKNKELASFYLTITILWMALVESAVIYWLIIAFQIMGNDSITMSASIWAWLAVWLAWFWAWYWEWKLIGWAITAIDRNPEIKWKIMTLMVLFVALVESAAIYWLVVAFKILWAEDMDSNAFIWMWCAVWFAWLWVSIWEWLLAEKSMEVIWKRQDMTAFFLTLTILWIALVESAAIYWLIVAFQLFAKEWISLWASIWTWLSIWLAWLWAWLWEWILVWWAIKSIDKNPEMKWKIMTLMVLFVALVESAAIYWLVISFKILWMTDFTSMSFIWMWLAVWLAWLWVSIWEWIAAEKSLIAIWKRPEMLWFFLTVTILWIALVESAAIYWLIVAFQLFWTDSISLIAAAWAWLAIWLAWLWAWAWEWILVWWAISAMETNPEAKWKIMTLMVLFVALVESAAIYWLVIAFKIIWMDDFTSMAFLWMWFAIWFAWLWVSIWEWIAAEKSLLAIWRKPDMTWFFLTVTILWIALVESAAIYWLIVAFQLIVKDWISMVAAAWAWLAIWLAWLWAWVWEWILVWWAIKAMEKNPEVKWKIMTLMVLFVALVESAAIYWLVISFKILWMDDFTSMAFLWMWFAIWFAWLWVSIWEWIAAEKSLESIWMRPKMTWFFLTVTILWIALVESAAIYWLIISFQLFWNDTISLAAAAWTWLAIWLAWLWAWVWEWVLVWWAINAMARNPEIKNKLLTLMVLFVALVESAAIYWLVISFNILWLTDTTSTAYTWMWLAIWLAWLWVSIWEWYLAKWSLEVIWKNPKAFGFFLTITILWIALIESAAIYWLIIAFQIWSLDWFSWMLSMTAWFAIWLAWLWAWVWEWLLIKWAIDWMNIAPESRWKTLTLMVLFVALVEVVAIYWLIVAFKVLW